MNRFRFERDRHGLTQDVLSEKIGIAQPTISLIETGRLKPTPAQLEALARFFNVSPPERLLDQVVVVREVMTTQPAVVTSRTGARRAARSAVNRRVISRPWCACVN